MLFVWLECVCVFKPFANTRGVMSTLEEVMHKMLLILSMLHVLQTSRCYLE